MAWKKTLLLAAPVDDATRNTITQEFPDVAIVDGSDEAARRAAIPRTNIVYGGLSVDELKQAGELEFVQLPWIGLDGIRDEAWRKAGVRIANGRGNISYAVAEHSIGLILAFYRRLTPGRRPPDAPEWSGHPRHYSCIRGRTVGLLGTGSIAQEAAPLFRAFGCAILGCNRRGVTAPGIETIVPPDNPAALFREADIALNSLPGTDATRGFVTREMLDALGPEGLYVNVGRGATDNEDALLAALREGTLGGACLDVFPREPLPPDHPFWHMPNVVASPHTGGANDRHTAETGRLLVENMRRLRDGEPLAYEVDPALGY
jgi:phosphoglycerate dehydrogenase-like enzyme